MTTPIRDRVVDLRRVRADQLRPHPLNWRKHPTAQRTALTAVLNEIGYAGALLARECDDGTLELIDGHLRAETTPEAEVPVLVVDLSAEEAALLLSVHDPLAAMAETDASLLEALISGMQQRDAAIAGLLADTIAQSKSPPSTTATRIKPTPSLSWRDQFQIVVDCRDEAEQRRLFERFTAEGLTCRVSVL
ncbi:MAG: hypothetical protein C0483_20470 [Pirellula sp.]|nr:hypothetical protein [Pirellula sp.]